MTFVLTTLKHSVKHRPNMGEQVKADKEREKPRKVGPPDKTISVRSEGTTVQMWDSRVAGKD